MRNTIHALLVILTVFSSAASQSSVLRDRGESYHLLTVSNTSGFGNIWVSGRAVGHVWDDEPATLDSAERTRKRWISNVRAFPEIGMNIGVWENVMLTLDSRLLGWGWKPEWASGALKWTPFENKDLRLHGAALKFKYSHRFTEGPPTIGGYKGFMPEGFVVEGGTFESWLLYETDMLAKYSFVPFRFIVNAGLRLPLERVDCWQALFNAGVVVNGYQYDFFLYYSLEAFNNFFEPKAFFTPPSGSASADTASFKKHLVYFSENPHHVTVGGNIRYENGIVLTLAVPLLVSFNQQSRISWKDLQELNRSNRDLFPDEVRRGIKDPFDPWFVKWKISAAVTFPLKYRTTSTEMLRNYLLLKNRKDRKTLDFDQSIGGGEEEDKDSVDEGSKKRLEEIRKRREEAVFEK
ncbi:MAG: hypothetical protein ACLFQB_08495 [Chitinispirillaceae bacterium]